MIRDGFYHEILLMGCFVFCADKETWKAASSVLQVNELWQALEHFNMQQSLGHRITKGRREDAVCMLKDLATTVCYPAC